MQKTLSTLVITGSMLLSTPLLARDISVEVTNLTNAAYFTQILVAAHSKQTHLFELSSEASLNLQAMAEGGDTSGLIAEIEAAGGDYVNDPAGGLLAPGKSALAELEIEGRRTSSLSVVAMILPTNDGFMGLDGVKIPKRKGIYTYYVKAYDAGTEANDEIINGGGAPNVLGIPADPGGNAGSGGVSSVGPDHNPKVHIHRGVVGDDDPTGGISDLDSRVHQWRNPVARVVITVGRGDRDSDD